MHPGNETTKHGAKISLIKNNFGHLIRIKQDFHKGFSSKHLVRNCV